MKYQGSCHCKTILFEFESEIITDALQCNCSICIRKNAIMTKHYIEPYAFNLLKGEEHLAVYHWGDHDVNHYFCKNCGIYPFHSTTYEPKNYRVNLGCVDSVDPRNLTILYFDGKNQL
ncbi:GFA family protein [Shewanella sp. VB17]|uniref:GFA family protein n=1 Tax=Shewanella sp. VB17 TaxID=2739432 RepID=UPI00156476EB|nr:GFA family protein [Shewanella sp. VB17]NRD75238.1 GFA family protein [Shewanella sp. VB17]